MFLFLPFEVILDGVHDLSPDRAEVVTVAQIAQSADLLRR
jgi:hypothetical protein